MSVVLLTVVVYDVSSDRRRSNLHALLKQYGVPVQKSAFEARMTAREREQLLRRIASMDLVDPQTDRLVIYTLSHDQEAKIVSVGQARPVVSDPPYYLV